MTGFGEARGQGAGFAVSVEVRAVNNRHLKVTVRGSDPYPMLEPELEKVVRRYVKRGTLHINVRVERQPKPSELKLNIAVLQTYLQQIHAVSREAGCPEYTAALLPGVLALPGVAPEPGQRTGLPEEEWPVVEKTLADALSRLDGMRRDEGRAMANELLLHHRHVCDQLELIRQHLPAVMADYRQRLLERVRQAIAEAGVTIEEPHLIREVALFADRTDVSEEVMRLSSHLEQFEDVLRTESDSPGRRLEFVVQEMGRETNTIGSKAGDVIVSRHVVEIKATLEKIRELVQNVE
jgi:uncharacterized protein (TIGR00255 family)